MPDSGNFRSFGMTPPGPCLGGMKSQGLESFSRAASAGAAPRFLTRRKFFASCALLIGGTIADMRLIEPSWLRVSHHRVVLGNSEPGTKPLRLLHLSDFHASDCVPLDFIESAVNLGLSLEPDLVCLTGDFISWQYEEWQRYSEILSRLSARAPAFACLGNHDGGPWAASSVNHGYPNANAVRELLARSRVELLDNSSRQIEIAGRKLRMAGVSDLYNRELHPERAMRPADSPAEPTVLLCHNPDAKTLLAPYAWDLMLCGHTHGGQCRIPLLGTPFAPVQDKRFVEGLHRWEDRLIHVTRGVGNLHGLRFNCRPEVSLLELA